MDGIFGLSLSPKIPLFDGIFDASLNEPRERFLYFHAMASTQENRVPLSVINNRNSFSNSSQSSSFSNIGTRGVQTSAQAMDSNGNLFFVLMNPIALVCWDSSTPYSTKNIKIVRENNITLQFASGVKINKNLKGDEEIWIMTNRYQVKPNVFFY